MSAPTHIHLDAAEDVLHYLISTKFLMLTFGLDDTGLTAHSDSDHASQPAISGNIFLYDGTAIAWSSRKQPLIALSSTEAKYIAAYEISWLCSVVGATTKALLHSPTAA
jgi:hypothetical protein